MPVLINMNVTCFRMVYLHKYINIALTSSSKEKNDSATTGGIHLVVCANHMGRWFHFLDCTRKQLRMWPPFRVISITRFQTTTAFCRREGAARSLSLSASPDTALASSSVHNGLVLLHGRSLTLDTMGEDLWRRQERAGK